MKRPLLIYDPGANTIGNVMRKQLITIAILTIVLIIAWSDLVIDSRSLSSDWAFLYWMTVATCAVVVLALSVNCLLEGRTKPEARPGRITLLNRRESFRVVYPEEFRPTLLVEQVDNITQRSLEFSIVDISEEGICFMDNGILGKAKSIIGRIVFKDGETTHVAFNIVRRHGKRISVRLQSPLPWATLIREQQKMLLSNKNG